jgi:hypothetical protein
MASHAGKRRLVLLEIHRSLGGDLKSSIELKDLADNLGWVPEEILLVVRQLVADGLAKSGSPGRVMITINGLKEAEKLDKPFHQRWPGEHPILFGFLMSVITGLTVLIGGKLFTLLFGW